MTITITLQVPPTIPCEFHILTNTSIKNALKPMRYNHHKNYICISQLLEEQINTVTINLGAPENVEMWNKFYWRFRVAYSSIEICTPDTLFFSQLFFADLSKFERSLVCYFR